MCRYTSAAAENPRGVAKIAHRRTPFSFWLKARRTGGQVDQPFEHLGFLSTGDGVLAVDQKAGNPVDAQPVGVQVFGVDEFGALGGGKESQRDLPIQTLRDGKISQNFRAANVQPLDEMGAENGFDQPVRDGGLGDARPRCWGCGGWMRS
jgi:hypothetical protein